MVDPHPRLADPVYKHRRTLLGNLIRDILKTHVVFEPNNPYGPPKYIGLSEYDLADALLDSGKVTTTDGAAPTEGEDDLKPSPHELLRRVFNADEDKRVTWATSVLAQSGIAYLCWSADHEGEIERLRRRVAILEQRLEGLT